MTSAGNISVSLTSPIASVTVVGAVEASGSPASPAQPDPAQTAAQMQQALDVEMQHLYQARRALEQAALQLGAYRKDVVAEAEEQLLELSLGIARKVLMQEIQAGRYEIEPIIKEALCHISSRKDVVVRLNPEDHARSEMVLTDAERMGGGEIRFLADPGVGPAECVVETSEGMIDSSPAGHLEDIAEILQCGKASDGG